MGSPGRALMGIAVMGLLFGSAIMLLMPSGLPEILVVQEDEFPARIVSDPVVSDYSFVLGLYARRYIGQVGLRYSFLTLDTSLDLVEANLRPERFGNLSDTVGEVAWLLTATAGYPVKPEILDMELEVGEEKYEARFYDFTKFFSYLATPQVTEEALTTYLFLFAGNGTILRYFKGISDLVDQEATGMRIASISISQGPSTRYYSDTSMDRDDAGSVEERPLMGVVEFDQVERGVTLSVLCSAEYQEVRWAECLQLIRIYANGKIQRLVANPITVSG